MKKGNGPKEMFLLAIGFDLLFSGRGFFDKAQGAVRHEPAIIRAVRDVCSPCRVIDVLSRVFLHRASRSLELPSKSYTLLSAGILKPRC